MSYEEDGYHSANTSMMSLEEPKEDPVQIEPQEQAASSSATHEESRHQEPEAQQENEEPEFRYTDSAYDSESLLGDDTSSLASYITDYRYEHGRRYHAYRDGAYWGPNDEKASDMQDLAHHVSQVLCCIVVC